MNKFDRCLQITGQLELKSSGKKIDPQLSVLVISELVDIYNKLDLDDKKNVRDSLGGKSGLILISFSGQFSALAIDENNVEWLKKAILLHIIEGFKFDYRENVRRLVFIYYAAKKIGENFNSLCKDIYSTREIDKNVAKKLSAFCNRNPELNQLEIYGMEYGAGSFNNI